MKFKTADSVSNIHYEHAAASLPASFGVLCWNVYKKNTSVYFKECLHNLYREYPMELIMLQEASAPGTADPLLHGYESLYISNLLFKKRSYGVVTASSARHLDSSFLMSHHQEFLLRTHKCLLLSAYALPGGERLVVMNVHAINFKNIKAYQYEIDMLVDSIRHYQGPLIICGDFNTWNKRRNSVVAKMQSELGLTKINFINQHHIKSFMNHPLDHMFYRGLQLESAQTLNCKNVSDHNPLYACFSTINS